MNKLLLCFGTLTLFLGTVYSGLIDPQILHLIKAAEQRSYYVVSPVHYLPSTSFLGSYPLFFPTTTTTNLADNVDLTEQKTLDEASNRPDPRTSVNEDTVSIESDANEELDSTLRLSPPDIDFEDSNKSDSDEGHKDVKKGSSGEQEDDKPENTYLPPKKNREYLPPKMNREYLPPKPVYGPPPTEAPVHFLATYIVKSYYEPGFSFHIPGATGHLPLFQPTVGIPAFHTLAIAETPQQTLNSTVTPGDPEQEEIQDKKEEDGY